MAHAKSEDDIELRTLFGQYPRLFYGIAGDLAYPGPFSHSEGGFFDAADLTADGMDVELPLQDPREDPRLLYETQAKGDAQGPVTPSRALIIMAALCSNG